MLVARADVSEEQGQPEKVNDSADPDSEDSEVEENCEITDSEGSE